jgi:sensor histidine kinase regulating citrate/malate metabolism
MLIATGIARRTVVLAWTITLFTLGIFVAVIIPEQKRDLRAELQSKASGVAVALQGEVAEATISEDYSSVVEHAMQVLKGDNAVSFLVITKNDGLSVVVDRKGWRMEPNTDLFWYPVLRNPSSEIGFVPMFSQRVFHYAVPFDYSSIQWGWIHVGLSLDSYDESTRQVNLRTGILEHFSHRCTPYPENRNQAWALSGVICGSRSVIARSRISLVRALAERSRSLSLDHAFSMGFKSGE